MGKLIHKSTKILGEITISTNVYISDSSSEVSITQGIYDGVDLVHKNNVMLPVSELSKILEKTGAKG